MTNKTLRAVERLAVETIDHLPDSIEQRRELLHAVLDALPKGSAVRDSANHMMQLMDQHDQQQRELILDFRAQHKKGNGDGR